MHEGPNLLLFSNLDRLKRISYSGLFGTPHAAIEKTGLCFYLKLLIVAEFLTES